MVPLPYRRPVPVGVAATVVAAVAAFVVVRLVPLDPLRWLLFDLTGDWMVGNPFRNLHYLAGLAGGTVAGYLTDGPWGHAVVNGAKTGVYGVVVITLGLFVSSSIAQLLGVGPSALFTTGTVLIILLLPLGLTFLVEGAFAGYVANRYRRAGGSNQER